MFYSSLVSHEMNFIAYFPEEKGNVVFLKEMLLLHVLGEFGSGEHTLNCMVQGHCNIIWSNVKAVNAE